MYSNILRIYRSKKTYNHTLSFVCCDDPDNQTSCMNRAQNMLQDLINKLLIQVTN